MTNITSGKFSEVDPIAERYILDTEGGTKYRVNRDNNKIALLSLPDMDRLCYEDSFANDDGEVGRIVPGGKFSGSMWIDDKCIGEYELVNGQYRILPYENGLKTNWQDTHPLDYLLKKVNQYSLENLEVAVLDVVQQIKPCSGNDVTKHPLLQDIPRRRVEKALSDLVYHAHIVPNNDWLLEPAK